MCETGFVGHEFYSRPSNSLPARSDQLGGKALSFDPPQHGDDENETKSDENVGFLMTENHFGLLKGRFFLLQTTQSTQTLSVVWMGWYPGLLVSGWGGVRYRAHYGAINHGDHTEL